MIYALAMMLAAAPAPAVAPQSQTPLLAEELVFEEHGRNRRALWTADPLLAPYPDIVRSLRRATVPEVRLAADDCVETMPCHRSVRHELSFAGTRLISIFAEYRAFLGGAHGASSASDFIWDRARNRRIRFGDLFINWRSARPILQTRVCAALRAMREEDLTECPNVDELAFGFADQSEIPVGGPATAIEVRTSDYQLGSYADGRQTAWVNIDAALLALLRPEYRSEFALAD